MAAFTAGNIVVYRVGTGTGSLSSAATAVFLDEYTTSGVLVQSLAMPTADNGANQTLTASGSASSEGELNLSADGQYLVLAGYDAAPGTASVAGTTSANVARVVALVSASGVIDTTTALTDAGSGNNIRAAEADGNGIWVADASDGLRYATLGATTSTQISTTNTNLRDVEIFNSQLYVSSGSGSVVHLGTVGTGEPTTGSQTIKTLPGIPASGSQYGFYLADLSNSVAGVDTLYVADDSAGITKYSLVGGSWVSNGVVGKGSDAYRGLTGKVNGDGSVTLFATGGGNKLVMLTDASGYNGAFAGSVTTIATASTNEAFRGVALAPTAPVDTTAPTLVSENPADNAADVAASSALVLTFSEAVKAGAGSILIRRDSDNSVVDSLDVGSAAVTFSNAAVTLAPHAALDAGVGYHVEIPAGAIVDLAGNAYAGSSDYNFTTAASETQTLSFASVSVSQSEGDSGVTHYTFTVQRAGGTTGDVSFTLAFAPGSTDAADYAGGVLPNATIAGTIAAGQTSATVTIDVAGDMVAEASESFTLTLTGSPTNDVAGVDVVLGSTNQAATGVIVDDDSYTHIYTIQGSGAASPLVGQTVTTRGVVTAVDTNGGESSRGFYIQDPNGDGDSATSDAIFVYMPSGTLPTVGHEVEVAGKVSEYKSSTAYLDSPTLTEMSVTSFTDLGVGPTIAPVQIGGAGGLLPPTADVQAGAAFWESLESMVVTLKAPTAVSPTDATYLETYVAVAGPDGAPYATGMNARGGLTVTGGAADYGNTDVVGGDFNPEAVQLDVDAGILPGFTKPTVDTGAQFSDVTGIVSYAYGVEQVLATQAYTVTKASTLQKETTTLAGDLGHLTVASYNVENLAPTDTARIAAHASEILNNLAAPDVVALQEIQDNDGTTVSAVTSASVTLQTLVDDLNSQAAAAGSAARYAWIDNPFVNNNADGTANGGAPGGNIRTAYIYRTDRVGFVDGSLQTIGADGSAITTLEDNADQLNTSNPFYSARPSLVAEFTFNGQTVTVIDNHFSSKGGGGVLEGTDPTPLDAYEDKRAAQAQAVNTYVDSLLAANPNAKIVVAGDLNEFQFEEPMKVLEGVATVSGYTYSSSPGISGTYTPGGTQVLTDLTTTLPASEQYDYNFDGNAEDLDHILVSDALTSKQAFDVVHINSEFNNQTSDHDPLVTSLALGGFTVYAGQTLSSVQTLGDGENGAVQTGGVFAVSATGKNNVSGVTFTGGTSSLTNAGAMTATAATGNARVVDSASTLAAGTTIHIVNATGGSIVANTNDAIRINADLNGAVTIDNSGVIVSGAVDGSGHISGTKSGQAIDLGALVSGTSTTTIINRAGGLIGAADADALRPGANATVDNAGTILGLAGAGDSGNDGVDFQDTGYGTVTNEATGDIEGARHGITGKLPITIHNAGSITGHLGSGVNLDTGPTTTTVIDNSGTIVGTAAGANDGDGVDVDGLVDIVNSGTIQALGTWSGGLSEAVTVGGGSIDNSGQLLSTQRAITVDDSNEGDAFAPTLITNTGLIQGGEGEAIKITDAFADTLTNKGAIVGSVDLGGGDDIVNLYAGSSISGALDGGAGVDTVNLFGSTLLALAATANVLGDLIDIEAVNLFGGDWTIGSDGGETVSFQQSGQTLRFASAALAGGGFDGTVAGFGLGDSIDFEGVGVLTAATLGAGAVLTLTGGSAGPLALKLDAGQSYAGLDFLIAADGDGSDVTVVRSVDVATFLANRATLDAAGAFVISDTTANIQAAIATLAGDANIAAIKTSDGGKPVVSAAAFLAGQAALDRCVNGFQLADTAAHLLAARNAILADAHVVYPLAVVDSGAGVSAAIDALQQAFAGKLTITLTGTTTLVVTAAQAAADADTLAAVTNASHALRINAPGGGYEVRTYGITGQNWTASDVFYGANGGLVSATWTNGGALYLSKTWDASGAVQDVRTYVGGTFQGVAYASFDNHYANGFRDLETFYDASGQAVASESFSADGGYAISLGGVLKQQKTVSAGGGYDIAVYGVTGQAYDAYDTIYDAAGKRVSQTWTKGGALYQSETWDGAGVVQDIRTYVGGTVQGVAYASFDNHYANGFRDLVTFYDASGQAVASETFSADGGFAISVGGVLKQQKTMAAGGGYDIAVYGVAGQAFDAYDTVYDAAGRRVSETWTKGGATYQTQSWSYNGDGSYLTTNVGQNTVETAYSAAGARIAVQADRANGIGTLSLTQAGVTLDLGASAQTLSFGASVFSLPAHPAGETITLAAGAHDVFGFHAGAGAVTLSGYDATDLLQFDASQFADFAHMLAAPRQVGADVVIKETATDVITLKNVSVSAINAAFV